MKTKLSYELKQINKFKRNLLLEQFEAEMIGNRKFLIKFTQLFGKTYEIFKKCSFVSNDPILFYKIKNKKYLTNNELEQIKNLIILNSNN